MVACPFILPGHLLLGVVGFCDMTALLPRHEHPYIGLMSVSASAATPLTHITETGRRPARASPVPTIKRKMLRVLLRD